MIANALGSFFSPKNYKTKLLLHQSPTRHSDYIVIDGVVSVVYCRQHGDYTVDQLSSHHAAGSCQQWQHCHCPVTVPSRWLMEKEFWCVFNSTYSKNYWNLGHMIMRLLGTWQVALCSAAECSNRLLSCSGHFGIKARLGGRALKVCP